MRKKGYKERNRKSGRHPRGHKPAGSVSLPMQHSHLYYYKSMEEASSLLSLFLSLSSSPLEPQDRASKRAEGTRERAHPIYILLFFFSGECWMLLFLLNPTLWFVLFLFVSLFLCSSYSILKLFDLESLHL